MNFKQKNFCFSTLALGEVYRNFAKQLAKDLEIFSKETKLIVLTDKPKDFVDNLNVLASKYVQQSPLFPYNEKRKAIEKALQEFSTVIFVDADSRVIDYFPDDVNWSNGIIVNYNSQLSFAANVKKYCPQDLDLLLKVAKKIELERSLDEIPFPTQDLYVITKDGGKEKDFLRYWDLIAKYLECHRCANVSDGYAMGLAMARVGWLPIQTNQVESLNRTIKHISTREKTRPKSFLQKQKLRALYHYRLTKLRLEALKDFKFFFS